MDCLWDTVEGSKKSCLVIANVQKHGLLTFGMHVMENRSHDTLRWLRGIAVTSLGVSMKLLYVGPG